MTDDAGPDRRVRSAAEPAAGQRARTGPLTWWRRQSLQRRDLWIAVLLAVVLLGWIAADGAPAQELALAALASVGLIWRRASPPVALTITSLALGLGTLDVGIGSGTLLQALIAVYSAISVGRRGLGTAVAVGQALGVPALVALRGGPWDQAELITAAALLAVAVALGLWIESRRATLAASRERAERAELTRELEAARAVAEERLRIARELHDVLGHHVAVINVHAGVAEALLTTRPEKALDALHNVQDATASVLSELASLVEVLREPGEAADRAPAPGLGSLEALVDEVRAAGIDLTVTTDGAWPPPLAPMVDLIAYRIVQESLTNARKHGAGSARLDLRTTATTLTIELSNPIAPAGEAARTPSGGHGLLGLRERAQSVGGTFEASEDDGDFRTHATLPTLAPAAVPNDRPAQERIAP